MTIFFWKKKMCLNSFTQNTLYIEPINIHLRKTHFLVGLWFLVLSVPSMLVSCLSPVKSFLAFYVL